MRLSKLFLIPFLLITELGISQIVITPGVTGTALTNAFLGNGMNVSNLTINCNAQQYGTFSNGNTTNLGLTNGILLTTGQAQQAAAIGGSSSGNDASFGCIPGQQINDPQLMALSNQAVNDVCIIEFDVIPDCNQLTIRFVFGSEEYPEYVNANFNDAFGFFVSGPNPGGGNYVNQNLALLPNGTVVSIDNVNNATNSAFYVANSGTTIEYDGFTTVLTRTLNLTPCASYHIKLAIGDASDCIVDSGVFIDFIACTTPPFTLATSSTPSNCGNPDGTATVTVSGGVGPFTYTWSPAPGGGQGTTTATGLIAGNYSVSVVDQGAGCGVPQVANVVVGSTGVAPNITVTPTSATVCNGVGTVLTASGGTSYTWSPATGLSGTTGAVVTATPTTTTVYTVTGTGACGNGTASTTITVNPIPVANAGPDVAICVGGNTVLSGSGGGTYSWSPAATLSNPNIANPSANPAVTTVYTLTVTTAGCTATDQVTVSVSNGFNATITPAGPFCSDAAAVNLTAVDPGGTWSGTGITNAATGTFNPATAGAGTHTITYSIPGACGDTQTTNITVNAVPSTTAGSNSPICEGSTLNLTATLTAGATYSWTGPNGFTSAVQNPTIVGATPAASGAYTVTINNNGCTSTSTVNVTVNALPTTTAGSNSPICAGNALNLTATGTGTFSWTGPNGFTSALQNPTIPAATLAAGGLYTVTISNNGCNATSNVNVIVNSQANATIVPAGPFCSTDAPVVLSAAMPGGTWSGTGITNPATGAFDPSIVGNNTVTITYTITGPCGDTQTTNIVVTGQLDATINPVGPFCISNGSVNLTAASPGGVWSGTGITNAATGTFNPATAGAGTHVITYTIAGNCGNSASINIVVNPNPVVTFSVDNPNGCSPVNATLTNTTANTATATWSINGTQVSTNPNSYSSSYISAGCYDVTLAVTDNNGCSGSGTVNSMICVSGIPSADFTFSPDNATVLAPIVQFNNQSTNATSYLWVFDTTGTSTLVHPSHVFPNNQPNNYNVCLFASNAAGCIDSICKIVTIYDDFIVYVPNAFTVDYDGKNDIFLPIVSGHDPLSYEFYIFNRWGDLIFESHNAQVGWNGMHRGQLAKQDVYVWKLKTKKLSNNEKVEFYGHVTLLR